MKVKVNEHYDGTGWYDPKSGIKFSKGNGPIEIPEGTDIKNINRYIARNYLVVVADTTEAKEDTWQPSVILTPAQILKETKPILIEEPAIEQEPEEEAVVEKPKEAPEINENGKVNCQFCGKEYSPRGISTHERACKENPENS